MNGDDKACFDAGRDDDMAKPIDADILFEKLREWVPNNNPGSVTDDLQMQEPETLVDDALADGAPVHQALVDQSMAIWEKDAFYARIRLKPERGKRLITLYTDDVPPQVLGLKAAISSNDANEIKQMGHSIQGVSATINISSLVDLQCGSVLDVVE